MLVVDNVAVLIKNLIRFDRESPALFVEEEGLVLLRRLMTNARESHVLAIAIPSNVIPMGSVPSNVILAWYWNNSVFLLTFFMTLHRFLCLECCNLLRRYYHNR